MKQQGLDLGLSSSQIVAGKQSECIPSTMVRNQYSWVRVCNHSEFVWRNWLDVPECKQYTVSPVTRMLPPTMFSEVMWKGIASESETARLIAQSPRRTDRLEAVLDHSYFAYSGMGTDWRVPRMIEQKGYTNSLNCNEIFKDPGFWQKIVRGPQDTGGGEAVMQP